MKECAPLRVFVGAAVLGGLALHCKAAEPPPAAQAWFVPPPSRAGIATSATHNYGSYDEVTVTATRRPTQRNPHGEETRDFQPAHSDAASPSQGVIGQSHCDSALQTIAGQPASGMDMVSMGGGHCD